MNRTERPTSPPRTDSERTDGSYEAPRLTVLGGLADLTAGGNVSDQEDAGGGYAGASGNLP